MKVGIIGLTASGKSTLFQLLTGMAPPPPGGRPEPRLGVARVPDPRLTRLAQMFMPRKTTPATVEYVDVPGVRAGHGADLADLPALRDTDAFLHVIRMFENAQAPHPEGTIDPKRDDGIVALELLLADLGTVERRIERLDVNIKKTRRAEDKQERDLFLRLREALEAERPLRSLELGVEDQQRLRGYSLLSLKPLLLVPNLAEDRLAQAKTLIDQSSLRDSARASGVDLCVVSAPIEMEIARLKPEEGVAFIKDLGLEEPCLHRIIRSSYALMGRISFLTVGPDECRAWTIRRGTRAHEAAGIIHSDIERGFIRAEVVSFERLEQAGSLAAAREKGWLRLEGKEYVIQDGDIVHFRFHV
ncbi:MAG: redox-regulated ATPase YchF [Vicinamibacteria bacterium]|nr:redox-regulated ATPase YchF [Vicinamibacteria bacterium]